MEPVPPARPRVALAITPRLLEDSLASLLAAEGIDSARHRGGAHVAIAIVTPDALPVAADVAIVLGNGEGASASAVVQGDDGAPVLRLDGLPAIMQFVRTWAAGHLEHTGRER